jgi:CAAX prenyl protease-like protein
MHISQPIFARILPFVLFLGFIALANGFETWGGNWDSRWLYPIKVVAVAAVLAFFWKHYEELRMPVNASMLVQSVLVGLVVFVLWINLDQGWLDLGGGPGYDPRLPDGSLNWTLVVFRLAGAALVVPVMEELFWRSFLMRWIDRHDFLGLPVAQASVKAVLVSSVLFGLEHTLWFAGILAGLAYALLYRKQGSLWAPIVAHATTNFTLGIWVLYAGAWQFW